MTRFLIVTDTAKRQKEIIDKIRDKYSDAEKTYRRVKMKPEYSRKAPKGYVTPIAAVDRKIRLCVKEDGIHECQDIYEIETGEVIQTLDVNMFISKEIFVEAYKKYIGKDLGE